MNMSSVKIVYNSTPTHSNQWKSRRINMMYRKLWKCCAYTDPSGIKGVYTEHSISPDGSTYQLIIRFDGWTREELDRFGDFAKQVNIFHKVELHFTPEHDTIST